MHHHEHVVVLANLFHNGDNIVQKLVDSKINSDQLIYFGLNYKQASNDEKSIFDKFNLKNIDSFKIKNNDFAIFDNWIKDNNFKKVYTHRFRCIKS